MRKPSTPVVARRLSMSRAGGGPGRRTRLRKVEITDCSDEKHEHVLNNIAN